MAGPGERLVAKEPCRSQCRLPPCDETAAARLGAALMPSSSSDALPLVAAVACVALLAVVATRRARKTSFVNGEEADGLLNANTYGAIYNA